MGTCNSRGSPVHCLPIPEHGDYIEVGGGGFSVEHYSQQEEDKLKQNWTEIILAFTFTVTVVLIFILFLIDSCDRILKMKKQKPGPACPRLSQRSVSVQTLQQEREEAEQLSLTAITFISSSQEALHQQKQDASASAEIYPLLSPLTSQSYQNLALNP